VFYVRLESGVLQYMNVLYFPACNDANDFCMHSSLAMLYELRLHAMMTWVGE
jgi:hypothetical protein